MELTARARGHRVDAPVQLRDRTGRQRDEAALRQVRERLDHVVASSPAVLYQMAVVGPLRPADVGAGALAAAGRALHITWMSPNVEDLLGYGVADTLEGDWWPRHVHVEDRAAVAAAIRELFGKGDRTFEYRMRHRDGTLRWVRSGNHVLRDDAGRPVEIVGSWSDITQERSLEAQLAQAQRVELLGQVAGGVAHDFNNLMGVITGYGELLLRKPELNGVVREYLGEIAAAAARATGLTRHLLAFSRKQDLQPRVLDLNAVVGDVRGMLWQLVGEDIDLVTDLAKGAVPVRADPGQVEQVLMNLAVNARDAMPHGGVLKIQTGIVDRATDGALAGALLEPGPYARLDVSDNGHGMDAATQARVFEPFFTTKQPGKGTGLGLAVVHGIVKQGGGQVLVHSERGRGTRFSIYLPRAAGEAAPAAASWPWRA